jgi:hypothetical protein
MAAHVIVGAHLEGRRTEAQSTAAFEAKLYESPPPAPPPGDPALIEQYAQELLATDERRLAEDAQR